MSKSEIISSKEQRNFKEEGEQTEAEIINTLRELLSVGEIFLVKGSPWIHEKESVYVPCDPLMEMILPILAQKPKAWIYISPFPNFQLPAEEYKRKQEEEKRKQANKNLWKTIKPDETSVFPTLQYHVSTVNEKNSITLLPLEEEEEEDQTV